MKKIKSPFYVAQEFISPLICEEIIDDLHFIYPDIDPEGKPIKSSKSHFRSEEIIFDKLEPHVSKIENYYANTRRGTEPMSFEWYPQGCHGEKPHCENSEYLNKSWVKVKDRDLTCVLFLCDYQETVPFDNDFEVFGGKLEFFQWGFGFNPQRGTLVVFPSGPNFINATASIQAGDLYQVRFHISFESQFTFNPADYPGDFTTWFEELA